ncbi:MCP four helix bundle domain-containing protein [Tistrella bauzanensis]
MSKRSLSIGQKLSLAFATLTSVIFISGMFALWQFQVIEETSLDLRANRIPSLTLIADIDRGILQNRIQVAGLVLEGIRPPDENYLKE